MVAENVRVRGAKVTVRGKKEGRWDKGVKTMAYVKDKHFS